MSKPPNYIEDTNPFRLAGPPDFFLRKLWDFDPSLAMVPSRQGFYYRLAQRRQLQLPDKVVNDVLREQADTRMLATYGLVPVTTILATANWDNPLIFVELTRRAPWRMGGADKFHSMVADQDRKEDMDKAIKQDEHLTDIAKDSWNYYNKLIGLRSHLYSPKTKSSSASTGTLLRPDGKTVNYQPQVITTWGDPRKG